MGPVAVGIPEFESMGRSLSLALHILTPRVGAFVAGPPGCQQMVLRLEPRSTGGSSFRWLLPSREDEEAELVVDPAGNVVFSGPSALPPDTRHVFGLSVQAGEARDEAQKLELSVDGIVVGTIPGWGRQLRGGRLLLAAGAACDTSERDFEGDIFDVRVWYGRVLGSLQLLGEQGDALQPDVVISEDGYCPQLTQHPWTVFRERAWLTVECLSSPATCTTPTHPYRVILRLADEIMYQGVDEHAARSEQCPLGFALAGVVITLQNEFEYMNDPMTTDGTLKVISALAPRRLQRGEEPTFGHARPVSMIGDLQRHNVRRILEALEIPARRPRGLGAGGATGLDVDWPPGLCVHVQHDAEQPLSKLRNAVETLATGGVLAGATRGVMIGLDACSGDWAAAGTPEGRYLRWLKQRFGAHIACDVSLAKSSGCQREGFAAAAYTLALTTAWHLLAYQPSYIAALLRQATSLFQAMPQVIAVSLSAKASQGLSGVLGSGTRFLKALRQTEAPSGEQLRDLVIATLSVTTGWDAAAAARQLGRIHDLNAEVPPDSSWVWDSATLADVASQFQHCSQQADAGGEDIVCVPASWWPVDFASRGDDVWLLSDVDTGKGDARIAVARGVFQIAREDPYDATAMARSEGVPDCFACHLTPPPPVPAAAPEEPEDNFTIYFVPLDEIGPCRELFSNLLLDTLEALQLASFQGPHATLVEPLISNAVWRRYSKEDADKLAAGFEQENKHFSIYAFWNEQTSCGLRHGSPTRFGDLFDWDFLVRWMRQVRGIKGGTSWPAFVAETAARLDVVAMMAGHRQADISCEDSEEPATMRFFRTDFLAQRRACIRSRSDRHVGSGFELRFLDVERLGEVTREAVVRAKAEGRRWASVGLYLYWVEGAERARLHPSRYGYLSSHQDYMSIWQGVRYSPWILRRAFDIMRDIGLVGARFLSAHWRRGDWFLGPHPRKLAQAKLADPPRFAGILRRHLFEQKLDHVFLMTNAPYGGEDVKALAAELPGVTVVQAPVIKSDLYHLRQLAVEMAIATHADFFVAFGDGIISSMASMPSLLVLQMRLYASGWPFTSNAFSFVRRDHDALGLSEL